MSIKRRAMLKNLVLSGTAVVAASPVLSCAAAVSENEERTMKGNIKQSVCQWTYGSMPLEELCIAIKKLGLGAIDLLAPKDWPVIKKHGIVCSMCYHGGNVSLTEGFNDKKFHPSLVKDYTEAIPLVAAAGYKNIICFSGNRRGMDDETGLKNCVDGLKQILPLAEKHGVIVHMELLNSKVDHKDYMADKSAWGVELCKQIGSENFKLLYDIYHMQIDEGDVIRTIQDNHPYFGHYHTAGVPGRHELNENQELQYPAIMRAIAATGFKGYVAQEFIPTGKTNEEKMAALRDAIAICDV